MTYSDAIEQVMLKYGGVVSLKILYREIWKYKDIQSVKGKTPENTIQERVQRDPKFRRVGLGVYALADKFDNNFATDSSISNEERRHAAIQGMLLEIGNHDKSIKDTYTNDKKWKFGNIPLGSLASLAQIPPFTYEHIILKVSVLQTLSGLMKDGFRKWFLKWNIQRIFVTDCSSLWNCRIFKPDSIAFQMLTGMVSLNARKTNSHSFPFVTE